MKSFGLLFLQADGESHAIFVLLNIAMFFVGMQSITFIHAEMSIYDLFVAGIALLLTGFFVNTALQEALKLAALGE